MPVAATISQLSHAAAAASFALLGVILLLRRAPTTVRLAVVLAAFLTAFWAFGHLIVVQFGAEAFPVSRFETLRTAAWVGVLLLLQRRSLGLASNPQHSFMIALGFGFLVSLQLLLSIMFQVQVVNLPLALQPPTALLMVASRLVMAIAGLVLLHNLFVNSGRDGGVSFRLFAVALGVIFVYDLNLYTLQFLTGHVNHTLHDIRGAVDALAVPLIWLAMRHDGDGRFQLSRRAAFQTVSFSIIGTYLIAMSLLSYGLKMTGGNWGTLLQVTFIVVTLIAGSLVALSPRVRAELRVRIARNFYRYRYDYRVEWLNFIDKIDADKRDLRDAPFRERLIEAIADVLDCPGGALFEPTDAGDYAETARWGWSGLDVGNIAAGSALLLFFNDSGRIVEFDRLRRESAGPGGADRTHGSHGILKLPEWAAADRAIWLGVPLVHRARLTGVLLLHRSLATHELNWEDFDLLRTLGRQGASYLQEARNQARLDEARSFEEYNRRFAFVMHDIKNVVSQLGLMARNARRHADNPEFQADMLATLDESVAKMRDLLQLMGRETAAPGEAGRAAVAPLDLAQLLTTVAAQLRRQHPALTLAGAEAPCPLMGDAARLEAMFTHLVQNAIDASTAEAPVAIELEPAPDRVRVRIHDQGHGMSADFIRNELFRPFRSTKGGGFGIGAYEAREIVRAHDGFLEVRSAVGAGTTFVISLPVPAAQPAPIAPPIPTSPPTSTDKGIPA